MFTGYYDHSQLSLTSSFYWGFYPFYLDKFYRYKKS